MTVCGESGDGWVLAAWVIYVTRWTMKRDELWTASPSEASLRHSEMGIDVRVDLYGEGTMRLESG